MENDNLRPAFRNLFRISRADLEEDRRETHRIRHDVYCEDLGFEPVREDGIEIDAHDDRSLHCLLRSAAPPHHGIGSVRVIQPDLSDPGRLFPFEITCADVIDRRLCDPLAMDRSKIGEISRLAVRSTHRRRKGEFNTGEGNQGYKESPDEDKGTQLLPYIPISLYMGAVVMASMNGIETLFMLTEPRLAEHFSKLGVRITIIGDPVDHRGLRVPSYLVVPEVGPGLRKIIQPLWKEVIRHMSTDLAPR